MDSLFAKGVYSLQDAARLLREKPSTLKRWAFGYHRNDKDYPPAITTGLPEVDGVKAITFLELIELLFIRGFLESGVSWPMVHEAARVAARLFDTAHPFAMKRWFADPAGIYAMLKEEGAEEVYVELAGDGQIAMIHALEGYLRQIDFDISGIAERWHPMGKDEPIVIDPQRAFGAPVVQGTSTRTSVLADMYEAGTPAEEIAWWYDLPQWQVESAIRFERELAAA